MRKYFGDLLLLLGMAALVYGVSLLSVAAAWIVGAFCLICLAVLLDVSLAAQIKPGGKPNADQ